MSLLSLPPEIRNFIYRHLFSDSTLKLRAIRNDVGSASSEIEEDASHQEITLTCRQIRREALPLLLPATKLHIHMTEHFDGEIVIPIKTTKLGMIRKLPISMRSFHFCWPLDKLPRLQQVTIECDDSWEPLWLSWNLDKFKSLRVETNSSKLVSEVRNELTPCLDDEATPELLDVLQDKDRGFKVIWRGWLHIELPGCSQRNDSKVWVAWDWDTHEAIEGADTAFDLMEGIIRGAQQFEEGNDAPA